MKSWPVKEKVFESCPSFSHIYFAPPQAAPSTFDYLSTFVSPLAIVLSASVALAVALYTSKINRGIARKRATLDVLLKLEGDREFQHSAATFKDIRDTKGVASLLDTQSKSEKDIELQVDIYLNHFELICAAIFQDTIDELFVFQMMRGSLIHDWHSIKEYVEQARERYSNPRIYVRIQRVAESWEGNSFITRKDKPSLYLNNEKQITHYQS